MAIIRVGELRRVFKGGESELLNRIARLSIFYEDLRLEMGEFQYLHGSMIEMVEPDKGNRVIYFLRRALATLVEFRGSLTRVLMTDEFKRAQSGLTASDAKLIVDADNFLRQNWTQIKGLRNEFAAHIQARAVDFAIKNLSNEVGNVTWNPDQDAWTAGIECHFAEVVLAGVISSKLQSSSDIRAELQKALEIISQGFNHAQCAMLALVHAFLWERFGK